MTLRLLLKRPLESASRRQLRWAELRRRSELTSRRPMLRSSVGIQMPLKHQQHLRYLQRPRRQLPPCRSYQWRSRQFSRYSR